MTLIRQVKRDAAVRTKRISLYEYCCRSKNDAHERYCKFWEECYQKYPQVEKHRVKRDFQSRRNETHLSACFELFLHELLIRLGFKVEVHPEKPEFGADKPDFVASKPANGEFLLEASCVFPGTEHYKLKMQQSDVVSLINENIESNKIRVVLLFQGFTKSEPGRREIIDPITEIVRRWEDQLSKGLGTPTGDCDLRWSRCWSHKQVHEILL